MKFIAKTLEGLEETLAKEIALLGGTEIETVNRAVLYSGDLSLLYSSNLWLRSCLRVLLFMQEFTVRNENDLYDEIKKIPWESYFGLEETFAIDSVVNSSIFKHANYLSLKTKDAIADRFTEKYGSRPNVDTQNPNLRINIHIREDIVTLSLDSSGSSLHMRGYRKSHVDAPLNEVLAAGLIMLSDWDKTTTLIDPMCGSGTILCEAYAIASNSPPQGYHRHFGFMDWNNFDNVLWEKICKTAKNQQKTTDLPKILGFDKLDKAVEASITNIEIAGYQEYISVEKEDFFYQEMTRDAFLIFNPPYDARIREDEILDFYKYIGDKLKRSFEDSTAWLLSGHIPAMKNVGLRPSRKIHLLNGSIPSLYCKYDLYKGSKKQKWQQIQNISNDTNTT